MTIDKELYFGRLAILIWTKLRLGFSIRKGINSGFHINLWCIQISWNERNYKTPLIIK